MLSGYETLKKKVLYKSCNRGWKETDILLGKFAKNNIDSLNERQLIKFDELLDESDVDIFNWLSGKFIIPKKFDNEIMQMIKNLL